MEGRIPAFFNPAEPIGAIAYAVMVFFVGLGLYKPFKKGDRIQVVASTPAQYETGVVEEVALGFTVLKTDYGRKVIIANGSLIQQTLIVLQPAAEPIVKKATKPTA